MIDVIEPHTPRKYGDTAEAGVQGQVMVTATTSGGNIVANTPPSSGEGSARTNTSAIIAALTTISTSAVGAASSLNARGRAVTFYEDDDVDILGEDDGEDEYYAEEDEEEGDEGDESNEQMGAPCLKASLLDYVLSEVANYSSQQQQMDLEQSQTFPPPRPSRRKYAFNPEELEDVLPHLSEYYGQNVIAVLNRCDPNVWGRCLTCGIGTNCDAVPPQETEQQEEIASNLKRRASSGDVISTRGGSRSRSVYEVEAFWNYYNYKSEYQTNSISGGNTHQHSCYQYHSEPTSPWINSEGSGSNQQQFFSMDYNQVERMRCNSDGENTTASSDLDGGNGQTPPTTVEMDEGEEVFTFDARLLSEAFLSSGRVDHTIQLMAYHPDYLEIFLRTHHFLMRGDGPLPYNFRNYIAIMAAARYRCSYLMELQKREFLYQGGDPNWLRGLDAAPPKLVALYHINKVMAHRPWVLKKEDLQHLTKKAGWSLSEVVQAVVLLAHFHSLSSFIHGCGITPEVDFDNGHTFLMDPASNTTGPVMPGNPEPVISMETKSPHSGVSFAVGPPSIVTTTNTLAKSMSPTVTAKQTKSILKKTENNLSTSPASSSSASSTCSNSGNVGSSNATSGGINVPSTVHFHPYHSHYHHHHYRSASLTSSPSLRSDALYNSQIGPASASSPTHFGSTVSEVDIIMATMKNLSETLPIEDPEERKKRFETVARCDLDSNVTIVNPHQKENMETTPIPGSVVTATGNVGISPLAFTPHRSMLPPDITPFLAEADFSYEDFLKRGQVSELHTFRVQDYSWEEHGFSLVNRLYAEVGQILDDKFKVAQSMTYYTIGGRANVDTTKFRTAVWNYIQCLYGIRHDDYDYGEVNQLLERPLKAYIKTVCCYPERVTKADYDNVMREFKHSEKVHVNVMIMEAKLQAELLYALRTVMKLMFNNAIN